MHSIRNYLNFSLMNKIEVALGALVMFFSLLAIFNICFNVTTVTIDPLGQRYAYADKAKASLLFIVLIVFLGIAASIPCVAGYWSESSRDGAWCCNCTLEWFCVFFGYVILK